jgi:hypothetical protein
MNLLPLLAIAAILSIASSAARAEEAVYPRVYTAEDCRDLDRQIDDSIRIANLDGASAAALQGRRAMADESCYEGQYAVGARQLRDILDDVIASGSRYRPPPPAATPPAGGPVATLPGGSWREACVDVSLVNGTLRASCLDRNGRYGASQLDIRSCRQPVSNQDGRLACGDPQMGRTAIGAPTTGNPPPPPPAAPVGLTGNGMSTAPARTTGPATAGGGVAPAPLFGTPSNGAGATGASAPPPPPPPPPSASGPAPDAPEGGPLPPGNWIASCRNSRMIGTILQSECQDRIGMWRLTAIDTRACRQPIANRNGGLSCY